MKAITISSAMESPSLFAPYFRGPSWSVWKAVLKAANAEPLDDAQKAAFTAVAGRGPPKKRVRELVAAVGRGGGKNSIASLLATLAAINFNPKGKLRPGEKAVVMALACDRHQAGILFGYVKGYFETIPALKALVTRITADTIELSNEVVIEIHTSSFRAVRGRSILCAILDEAAFFRDENFASPDVELHAALSPGLARVKNSMLIIISSVHKRSGLLYQRWKDHYGCEGDVLVVRGTTRQFNPSFDEKIIANALAEDRERYSSEYLSEWRDDLSTWLTRDLLDAAVDPGVVVRPPVGGVQYVAGCDASGGRNDSFTAAISHAEDDKVILDVVYERKAPFNPSEVVGEIATLLREYKCGVITGDKYGAQWTVEAFAKVGITYRQSEHDRSAVYMNCLPLFSSGRARLLDNAKLISQFAALERRTFSTGRERVDPGPGHDDCCNSAAIALSLAAIVKPPMSFHPPFVYSVPRGQLGNLDPAGYSSAKPGGWPAGSPQAGGPIHWTPPGGWRW